MQYCIICVADDLLIFADLDPLEGMIFPLKLLTTKLLILNIKVTGTQIVEIMLPTSHI